MATPELVTHAAPISTRRLGAVEVSVFAVADIDNWRARFSNGEPFVLADGTSAGDDPVHIASNALAIRCPERVVVVDPNEWPRAHTNPGSGVVFTSCGGLEATLAQIGIASADVTDVVFTHLHRDHFYGLTPADGAVRFPNARHYVPRADWDTYYVDNHEGFASDIERHLAPVERAGLVDFVDGDREVAPGVSLLFTPGESPGHSVVKVDSEGETLFYVGDLVHFPVEFERLHLMLDDRDPIITAAARRRICREAVATGGLVVFTHADFPGWGTIDATSEAAWRWRPL